MKLEDPHMRLEAPKAKEVKVLEKKKSLFK
jgi:hypothetical protein